MRRSAYVILIPLLVSSCAKDPKLSTGQTAKTVSSDSVESAKSPAEATAKSSPGGPGTADADVPAPPARAPVVRLALRLEEGQVYTLRTDTKQDVSETTAGRKTTARQRLVLQTRNRVESIDRKGSALVHVEFTDVLLDEQRGAERILYDSSKAGTEPPPPTPFAALKGRSYSKEIASTGEIVEVEGAEQLLAEILDAGVTGAAPNQTAYRQAIRSLFDAEALKDMEQVATPIFPDRELAEGDEWENRVVVRKTVPMVHLHTYRVVRIDADKVQLELTSHVEPNRDSEKSADDEAPQMELDLEGRQTGRLTIDRKSGLIVAATVHQDLTGTRTMTPPGGSQKIQSALTIRGTTEIRVEAASSSEE